MKYFTKTELKKYDGKKNRPIYAAYEGQIYDFTQSKTWKNGIHANVHLAGEDLTEAISFAPHGIEVFANYPVAGNLIDTESISLNKKCLNYLSDKHFHPIFSHFSISSFTLSPLFMAIYLLNPRFIFLESLSYHLLIIGLVSLPFSIATGIIDWWHNYSLDMTLLIKKKLIYSLFLFLGASICAVWRFFEKKLLLENQDFFWIYICLNISLFFYNYLLGKIGGELTYPS